jgi:hypothetical protein
MNPMEKQSLERRVAPWAVEQAIDRSGTTRAAHELSAIAMRQWERALTGVVALPAAVALSTAASALYLASMVERTFETIESAVAEIGRAIARSDGEVRANGPRAPEGRA